MPESRSIRDPIHRFIKLQAHEVEIVDSEVFQRLRNLRQLAFAYLVYRSAKYYITTQVVRHRIRLITDQMLIRAIILGIEWPH